MAMQATDAGSKLTEAKPVVVETSKEEKQPSFNFPVARGTASSTNRVSIGDTVRVRYLTEDKKIVQFTISKNESDPSNGVVYYKKPIAEALLGAEEGEEIDILVGSYLRQAVLEKIVKRNNATA